MSDLIASEYKCFEDIKRTRLDGSEYWCARELAPVLDYNKWENFHKVIKRAMIACENSGYDVVRDFSSRSENRERRLRLLKPIRITSFPATPAI